MTAYLHDNHASVKTAVIENIISTDDKTGEAFCPLDSEIKNREDIFQNIERLLDALSSEIQTLLPDPTCGVYLHESIAGLFNECSSYQTLVEEYLKQTPYRQSLENGILFLLRRYWMFSAMQGYRKTA